MSLGSKDEVVNSNKLGIFFGSTNQYILATRKEVDYRKEQIRVPTDAGPVYFTGLSNDKILLEFAYTTGEVGNSVPENWDEMMKSNATTGEVPENQFEIKAVDRQGTPITRQHSMTAKATRLRVFGGAEGETLAQLELQILDNNILVS